MKRYWIIAPYDSRISETFDIAWQYDLKNGTIAVGWMELGDISKLSEEELKARYIQFYKRDNPMDRNAIWKFYHEISLGDIVIARRGRKKIIGIGEVIGTAFFDLNKGKERIGNRNAPLYPNFLRVKWEEKIINYDRQVFAMQTLYEVSEEKYNSLIKGEISEDIKELAEVREQSEFVLEKYLEDFIVNNFKRIFGGKLELYEDEDGNGRQYPTSIGNIDILAIEPDTNSYVVIELKKGRESDAVVGQILRYICWVKENLAEGKKVKGLIICKDIDEKLTYALRAIPCCEIEVKRYKVDFQLF